MKQFFILYFGIFFLVHYAVSQTCGTIGQSPLTAFPVCGTNTFNQATVPICENGQVPSPNCTSNDYTDKNPFYYKFTCYVSGTLHFTINPNTNSDDYDWSLYDVTGQPISSIYTNAALTIASNWSGTGGNTGMDNTGNNQYVCGGIGKPRWTRPTNLVAGRNYILMISHFTNSQSGYSLSFGGGTAVITDPNNPAILNARASCDGRSIIVTLAKKMLCNSLATNASDFFINTTSPALLTASGTGCSSNFDTDQVTITLSTALTAGTYILGAKNGSDGNTMLDYCNKQIPTSDKVSFTYTPAIPTPIDSIAVPTCATNAVTVLFTSKQIKCSSVAPDGSDFAITGTYPASITSATIPNCTNGLTSGIVLQLNQPLYTKGTFTITLKVGTDGTTIEDECNLLSPPGSSKSFSVKDTVNANFSTISLLGCVRDTILAFNPVANEVNNWQWYSNDTAINQNTPTPQIIYTQFGTKNIKLIASNGFCKDTVTQVVNLDNFIKANFTNFEDNCPNDAVRFTGTSTGLRLTYLWRLGDGASATDTSTNHTYPISLNDLTYNVTYTITNNLGCTSSITKPVNILKMCGEYVPSIFTPNGDGINDTFGPLYAVKLTTLVFKVYNRWGQVVYQTSNWRQPWNGLYKGVPSPMGTYVWSMQYINRDTGMPHNAKGTVVLAK